MENREAYNKRREEEQECERIAREMVCAVCGGQLIAPWSITENKIIVCCPQDRTHQGFVKPLSWTQAYHAGEPIPLDIANQIKKKEERKMAEQLGDKTTKTLAPYLGVRTLTHEQATLILKSIWPDAPELEIFKAAITCKTYGLNPLMKHLYLIPFAKAGGKEWVQVLGIEATRLIARRQGVYSYKDGPRLMTEDEQKSIRGEVDTDNYWAITVVRDSQGNEAPGYGSWPRGRAPYGTDKGNTPQNMAFIRSERAALERLFPGEMPQGVEVADTIYLESPQSSALAPLPKEDIIPASSAPPSPSPLLASPPEIKFKNWGEFAAWLSNKGLKPSEFFSKVGKAGWTDFASYQEAYELALEVLGGKGA